MLFRSIQYKANKIQFDQFDIQNTSTAKSDSSRIIEWLMEKNREIVSQMNIGDLSGAKVFHAIFDEYKFGYEIIESFLDKKYSDQFIGITSLLLYNGVGGTSDLLNEALLKNIDGIKTLLKRLNIESVRTHRDNNSKYQYFYGHQVRLGNYFRNLFQVFTMIRNLDDKLFDLTEKYQLGKYLRSQMSGYEQMLLFFNSQSIYGKPMIDKNIISDFKIIKNIPLPLISFCIDESTITNKFPTIDFEWVEIKSRINA